VSTDVALPKTTYSPLSRAPCLKKNEFPSFDKRHLKLNNGQKRKQRREALSGEEADGSGDEKLLIYEVSPPPMAMKKKRREKAQTLHT
jgi:hypothetical protein